MSKVKASSSIKVCATCEKWLGSRAPVDSKKYSEYEDGRSEKCANTSSTKKGNETCSSWKKWSLIY